MRHLFSCIGYGPFRVFWVNGNKIYKPHIHPVFLPGGSFPKCMKGGSLRQWVEVFIMRRRHWAQSRVGVVGRLGGDIIQSGTVFIEGFHVDPLWVVRWGPGCTYSGIDSTTPRTEWLQWIWELNKIPDRSQRDSRELWLEARS